MIASRAGEQSLKNWSQGWGRMMKTEYIVFVAEVKDKKCIYKMFNNEQIEIGRLEKVRIGRWVSWCLFLNPDCYLSASCFDEVREKVRHLNADRVRAL